MAQFAVYDWQNAEYYPYSMIYRNLPDAQLEADNLNKTLLSTVGPTRFTVVALQRYN